MTQHVPLYKKIEAMKLIGINDPLMALIGVTLARIEGLKKTSNEVKFITESGEVVKMFHQQDCCEYVCIEDICGDVDDLIGYPLTMSEKVSNYAGPDIDSESHTWTFYKFATVKGYVTVRWLGESNGYYSESVDVEFEKAPVVFQEMLESLKPLSLNPALLAWKAHPSRY